MAHKKGLGSSRNGRDSHAKRLGVKVFAGEAVTGGEIIVRQRGTKFKPGDGVGIGKDDTIYAESAGTVQFTRGRRGRVISVLAAPTPTRRAPASPVGGMSGGAQPFPAWLASQPGRWCAVRWPAGARMPGGTAPWMPAKPAPKQP